MNGLRAILILVMVTLASGTFAQQWRKKTEDAAFLHRSVKMITDVMVHDIYAPPVASRTYAYVAIAAYEAAISGNPQYRSLTGQLNGFPVFPKPDQEICSPLAAVTAALQVGKAMVISERKVDSFQKVLLQEFRKAGVPEKVYEQSLAFGSEVAKQVLAWSQKDGYRETRSFPKYLVEEEERTWKPTPPAYLKAVEPHWNSIRPFTLDSAQQFKPLPPSPFSAEKESSFYQEALAVYEAGKKITTAERAIADFWDCNPFKMNTRGHVMFATKKISPGGHWINITKLACTKVKANFATAAEAYALVSLAIADGFISCWDEKYRSNVLRPETYINQYIDVSWTPLLQTPPFPEYTSGHSVISTAAAKVLTQLFGPEFAFVDVSEMEFGLPTRSFPSFEAAATEAAISRFYGGIHYMPAIVQGAEQGKQIAKHLLQKVRTKDADLVNK